MSSLSRGTKAWASVLGIWWSVAMLPLGGPGCHSEQAGPACTSDNQCGAGLCMNGTCLPRGDQRTVAVEILPRADSSSARTGLPSVSLDPQGTTLAADDRVTIDGTVTNAPNSHVVMMVASPLPGQPDLQFETDLTDSKFQITVGSSILRSMGTLWLTPSAEPQNLPPVQLVAMLSPSLSFTFPPVSQLITIRGVLHDSLDQPAVPFFARALVGSKVVSDTVTTDASGMFQLLIAPGSISTGDPTSPASPTTPTPPAATVILDFTPVAPDTAPRFQTVPVPLTAAAGNAKTRTFRMPAFLEPAPLIFVVKSTEKSDVIQDVTLRFRTTFPAQVQPDADGQAIYEQEARTDQLGQATVKLIPGTATDSRNYQITISPSPDSPYAARCVPSNTVTNIGNDGPAQYAATFYLEPKVLLRGTILSSTDTPADTVAVTATPIPVDSGCGIDVSASPVSSTTLHTGYYEMLVDPGTYQLDIDPPLGSDVPRLTQDGDLAVQVPTVLPHDVKLPVGEVIDGQVNTMSNVSLGLASVKMFQIVCQAASCQGPSPAAPRLLAQTRTNMSGYFRTVLPSP